MRPHKLCALMLELKGRELRFTNNDPQHMTKKEKGTIELKSGSEIQIFTSSDDEFNLGNPQKLFCTYKDLPRIVKPNDIIYVDDGRIVLLVTDCERVIIYFIIKYPYLGRYKM